MSLTTRSKAAAKEDVPLVASGEPVEPEINMAVYRMALEKQHKLTFEVEALKKKEKLFLAEKMDFEARELALVDEVGELRSTLLDKESALASVSIKKEKVSSHLAFDREYEDVISEGSISEVVPVKAPMPFGIEYVKLSQAMNMKIPTLAEEMTKKDLKNFF